MRSSRLLGMLLVLQRAGGTTATELAREFEVSVRTVYRDIQALQIAGVPVWTAAGPGGGVRLVDGWQSPVDGMTAAEAQALVIGGSGAADLGLASVLATARSKVRSGLPPAVRAQIDVLGERFLLDTQAWFSRSEPGAHLPQLARAVWDGHRVDIRYRRGRHLVSRRLDPLGLVVKAGVWYLVAAHRSRLRTYRTDRVEGLSVRDAAVQRPEDFALDRYWASAADRLDADIRRLAVVLRLPPASARDLRSSIPGRLTLEALDGAVARPDGRLEVRLPMESVEVAASQLARVPDCEVISPRELRSELASLGARLAEANR